MWAPPLLNPWTGTHMTTGSSCMSTKHVIWIHTSFVACNLQFRNVYNRMGKTQGTTWDALALDGNRPMVGEEVLYVNGWYRCICCHNVLVMKSIFIVLTFNLISTVLNPAMHFSWIQAEWEGHYIQHVRDIILTLVRLYFSTHSFFSHDMQMHQYCNQKLSMSEATTINSPVQDDLVSVGKPAPMQFKV